MVFLMAVLVNIWEERKKYKVRMSIKESLDLVGLPVVTFSQGDKKFNFLLDTGSNFSVVNENALEHLEHNMTDEKGTIYGIGGEPIEANYASLWFNYRDANYDETFQVVDMQDSVDMIKAESGVSIMGILGNSFFQKYEYILDFKELVVYTQ